ncbi:hypothetical protein ABZX75_08085 [Streptomyces sp. NPDC003038]|uniref:hypothetical protein n=1 Tax=unclassified Streptomyces TaxID=2593676 RepID=UPI0033A57C6D
MLLCIAGAGGLVLGGWALHDSYESHQDREASRALITEACAGLVDADTVMGLDGGTDRVVMGGEGPSTVDFETVPGGCVLSRLEERKGRDVKLSQFTLTIQGLPQQRDLHVIDDVWDRPFEGLERGRPGDATARTTHPDRVPLGDGSLGDYGAEDATVTARCDQPIASGATSLVVTAASPSTRDQARDRTALVRLAHRAAEGAARKLGCRARLPELPTALPAPAVDLTPVANRQDSCDWYAAHLRGPDRERLPDRALGVPRVSGARMEGCLLAVSPERAERVFPLLAREERGHQRLDDVLGRYPWWIRTRTYVGDDAAAVAVKVRRASPNPVLTGRAGRIGQVRYASATCQGRPGTFTMSVPETYAGVLGARLDAMFTTYATGAATRRGCTGLVLPGPE